jgi:pimeloyl-[acyl-carrier protein] synthase
MTTEQGVLEFNPFLPEVHADPYPVYRRLRELDAVHATVLPGVWLLTRHADCLAVLRDDRRFSSDSRNSDLFSEFREMFGDQIPELLDETRARSMLFVDPPDHTRLRTLVNKAFTARVVESMAPHIREIVDALLDRVVQRGQETFDVVAEVAYPLPTTVISEILAIPEQDREEFRRWSPDLVRALDPFIAPDILPQVDAAARWFRDYFERVIEERRRSPGDDVLSGLVHAQEHGDRLTREEVISTAILLLVAGHETTVNLIGNGTLALLQHPGERERLRADPGLIRSAVEELLRFDSPVQLTGRTLLEDVEIDGRELRRGNQVITSVAAANRDPERFHDPDRLDLGRQDNHHLAFSAGIHFCLGAPLARAEGQAAIGAMTRRFPAMRLATDEVQWRPTVTLRGPARLPVRTGP